MALKNIMEQKLEMFRNLIETQEDVDDTSFASSVNSDMLAEMIYVFTPKGDVVELPRGATPVDFAYRIHSDVGDKTTGAIVNDFIVPLNHELDNNDIVKIKTSPNSTPNKDWLGFVKTSQAKNKIKSYFSKQERLSMIEKGKNILERELRKQKLSFNDIMNDESLKRIKNILKLEDLEDIYLSIGTLRYTSGYIINIALGTEENIEDALIEKVNNRPSLNNNYKNDIIVSGLPEILVNIAKCCKPVKGDNIIGYVTKGEGVTVHNRNCPNISNNTERLINVSWNEQAISTYLTDLYIETENNKNYLTDIIATLTKRGIYVDSIKTKEYPQSYLYETTLKVKDKIELDKVILDFENLPFIINVRRNK